MAILKAVGRGFLYIIGLPFFLIVLLGTAVAGLFMLVFMFVKSIFLFFTGRSLDDDLPEDIKTVKVELEAKSFERVEADGKDENALKGELAKL